MANQIYALPQACPPSTAPISQPRVRRSRASKPKVKTGCLTCKYVHRHSCSNYIHSYFPRRYTEHISDHEESNAMKQNQAVCDVYDLDINAKVTLISRDPVRSPLL